MTRPLRISLFAAVVTVMAVAALAGAARPRKADQQGKLMKVPMTLAVLGLCAGFLPVPAEAAQLSAADKAQVRDVANAVLDRYIDQVFAPAVVQLRRAQWSSTKQPYTDAMAEHDRRLAYLVAGATMIGHRAVDKGIAVAGRAGTTAPEGDPRVEFPKNFDAGWAEVGGTLAAMIERRWPVDKRHAPLAADLERRFGGHEAFKERAKNVKPRIPGRKKCDVEVGGQFESVSIDEPEDYRRYKAAHGDRNWATRKVREELLPLVAVAPCLAYFEIVERGDAREGLRTLGDAIEVSGLLRIPPDMTSAQAGKMIEAVVGPFLHMVAFLGWLDANMP